MTDINLAYNFNDENDANIDEQKIVQRKQSQSPPMVQHKNEIEEPSEIEKLREKRREIIQQPSLNNIHREQYINYTNTNNQQRHPEYSFWDRMIMSKREVLKLFILSIVIILGISLEKIGSHYINSYLTSTDLSTYQELIVRLSFPIIVFIILWIIKSL